MNLIKAEAPGHPLRFLQYKVCVYAVASPATLEGSVNSPWGQGDAQNYHRHRGVHIVGHTEGRMSEAKETDKVEHRMFR